MCTRFYKLCFLLSTIIVLFHSCAEEIVPDFPDAFLVAKKDLLFKDTTICIGQDFTIQLNMNRGEVDMTELEIYEGTLLLPTSRFIVQGAKSFDGSNPIKLIDSERQNFSYTITILADPRLDTIETRNYFFKTVDELKQPATRALEVNIGLPSIELLQTPSSIVDSGTVFIGGKLNLRASLNACWEGLTSLEIFEEGNLLPNNQISIKSVIDSSDVGAANPLTIREKDKAGAIYDIAITPSQPLTDSLKRVYFIRLINNNEQEYIKAIKVVNVEPTPLELSAPLENFILFNSAAGEGNGGLDLDTGMSLDAEDERAEIQDEGILTAIDSTINWRKQISVVDSASTEIRAITSLKLADFTFKEQIIDAFNSGFELAGDDNQRMVSDRKIGEQVSEEVKVGSVFVVRREGKYYVIECTRITNESTSDQDRYEFSVIY